MNACSREQSFKGLARAENQAIRDEMDLPEQRGDC